MSAKYLGDYFDIHCGGEEGAPPPVNLEVERLYGSFVRQHIRGGLITACHDLSDGGLLVSLAEMALAGRIGAQIDHVPEIPAHAWYFGEDQARYLCTIDDPDPFLADARANDIPAILIGRTGGNTLILPDCDTISIVDLRRTHESWLPNFMNEA